MRPLVIAAVDPGKHGSACKILVKPATENIHSWVQLLNVIAFNGDSDWEVSLYHMLTTCERPDVVAMENVHSKRGQGVKGVFTFGAYKGDARTAIKFAGFSIHWVEQTNWPRTVGLVGSSDKKKRKAEQDAKALELFPELANVKGDIFASALIATAVAIDQCPDFRAAYMAKYAPPVVPRTAQEQAYLQRLSYMLGYQREPGGKVYFETADPWEDLK